MQALIAKCNCASFFACNRAAIFPPDRCFQRRCRVCVPSRSQYSCGLMNAAANGPYGPNNVLSAHVSALLGAFVAINGLSPLVYALPAIAATEAGDIAAAQQQAPIKPVLSVANAPDVHDAEGTEPLEQNHWWQQDAATWTELTSPTELTAYISSPQPPPAWPALANNPVPKLKLIEFYATWCPACKAAAPGMAAAAGDAELQQHCSFARVNVDRVKPLMKQLGVSRIPTVMLVSPDGRVLDTFRASGQVARDAILLQAAALEQAAAAGRAADQAPTAPEITPEMQGEELIPLEGNGNGSSSTGTTADQHSTSSSSAATAGNIGSTLTTSGSPGESSTSDRKGKAACSITPEPACAGPSATATSNSSSSSSSDVDAAAAAKQQFLAQYGPAYGYNGWLQQNYQKEIGSRLGAQHHYLDYTGAALYPASLLQAVFQDLLTQTYGNPHSAAAAAAATGLPSSEAPAAAAAGAASTSAFGSSSSSSISPRVAPAAASEQVMEQAALAVLEHLNADPAEYQVVFTRSATEALKLVGEIFPWSPGSSSSSSSSKSKFVYTRSNHNSVLGIGAYAAAAGAELVPLNDDQFAAWLSRQQQQQQDNARQSNSSSSRWQVPWGLQQAVQPAAQQQPDGAPAAAAAATTSQAPQQQQQCYHLLAYPAQDNFAGVIYPLDYINQAHAASSSSEQYVVLLDAAAYLPTHTLDLAAYPADFVVASFYKMFGYPTGLGALVLRTELVPHLQKVYFGGGSVSLATPDGCWHVAKCDPAAALTDGTPNYLAAAALKLAYESWDSRGGMQAVEAHTQALSSWLYEHLDLHHSNGQPLLNIYGKHKQQYGSSSSSSSSSGAAGNFNTMSSSSMGASGSQGGAAAAAAAVGGAPQRQQPQTLDQSRSQRQQQQLVQGSIFNFQVLQPNGKPISYHRVERDAAVAGIDLRSGCVCNPGACYDALGLAADEVQGLAGLKEGCGDDMDFITVKRPVAHAAMMDAVIAAGGAGDGSAGSISSSEQQQQQLVDTQVPLGSVRASLGWASTFEDAYAFVQFLKGYLE